MKAAKTLILAVFMTQVVKGLGETLVGAYPGRALSFICKKHDLNSPQVIFFFIMLSSFPFMKDFYLLVSQISVCRLYHGFATNTMLPCLGLGLS